MNYWKIVGYIGAILLILAITVGVGIKMTQKAEGYKANGDQYFYSFEPHWVGCARYDAFRIPSEVKIVNQPVSNTTSNSTQ